jgi:hypothetical protein
MDEEMPKYIPPYGSCGEPMELDDKELVEKLLETPHIPIREIVKRINELKENPE